MRAYVFPLLAVLLLVSAVGCGQSEGDDETTLVKPMDDYRNEAASQITPANADAEMEKVLGEIDADAASN